MTVLETGLKDKKNLERPVSKRHRKSGVSIMLTFGITFVVMLFSFFLLTSVLQTLIRTANIERTNQILYATETGLEAGFFHANIRGGGVHFCPTGSEQYLCNMESVDESQKITLDNGTEVSWAINGRQTPVVGLLGEYEEVEIPLFWDAAMSPTDTPTPKHIGAKNIQLNIYNNPVSISSYLKNQVNENYKFSLNSDVYDYSNKKDNILMSWKIAQGEETLIPFTTIENQLQPCKDGASGINTYICANKFFTSTQSISHTINRNTKGIKLPGMERYYNNSNEWSINRFLYTNKQPILSLKSLTSYADTKEKKIEGVPYYIKQSSTLLPTPNYTVFAKVDGDGFTKETSLRVPHKKSSSSFSYIIFD